MPVFFEQLAEGVALWLKIEFASAVGMVLLAILLVGAPLIVAITRAVFVPIDLPPRKHVVIRELTMETAPESEQNKS